jgi:3-phenylpropionate/cinnamic acid dioxygenase small subunit
MSGDDPIRRTLARYPHCHDDRDVDGYVALFAENGHFIGANADHAGRPAIRKFIANAYATQPANRRTKHLCGNSLIDVHGDSAEAITDFVAYERLGDEPWRVHTIGRYLDRLILEEDGEWRFAERRVETGRTAH